MSRLNGAELIRTIAQSLRDDPSQFRFEIKVDASGVTSNPSGPGSTGILASPSASHGGTAIGVQSNINIAETVALAKAAADDKISDWIEESASLLDEIASDLESERTVASKIDRMVEMAIPTSLIEIVKAIASGAVG